MMIVAILRGRAESPPPSVPASGTNARRLQPRRMNWSRYVVGPPWVICWMHQQQHPTLAGL